jgi:hypothetical protein
MSESFSSALSFSDRTDGNVSSEGTAYFQYRQQLRLSGIKPTYLAAQGVMMMGWEGRRGCVHQGHVDGMGVVIVYTMVTFT